MPPACWWWRPGITRGGGRPLADGLAAVGMAAAGIGAMGASLVRNRQPQATATPLRRAAADRFTRPVWPAGWRRDGGAATTALPSRYL
jgi:hypothetical protein